jgi:transcriptional regulator with XRE-family HTH domain
MHMRKTIYTGEYQALVLWLRAQRVARGMTMRDLAVILEVPHSFIGKVETRERRIDLIEFVAICRVLSVSPHDGLNVVLTAAGDDFADKLAVAEVPGKGYGMKARADGSRARRRKSAG